MKQHSCTRDLEDYTRLWVDTKGITVQLETGTYQLALEWKSVSAGSPAIRLFPAVEGDGGTLYLTDTNTAGKQVEMPYGTNIVDSYVGQTEVSGSLP